MTKNQWHIVEKDSRSPTLNIQPPTLPRAVGQKPAGRPHSGRRSSKGGGKGGKGKKQQKDVDPQVSGALELSSGLSGHGSHVDPPRQRLVNQECSAKTIDSFFNAIDANGSGDITQEEFAWAVEHIAAFTSKLTLNFNVLDMNRDGRVEYIEFAQVMESMRDIVGDRLFTQIVNHIVRMASQRQNHTEIDPSHKDGLVKKTADELHVQPVQGVHATTAADESHAYNDRLFKFDFCDKLYLGMFMNGRKIAQMQKGCPALKKLKIGWEILAVGSLEVNCMADLRSAVDLKRHAHGDQNGKKSSSV